MKKQYRASGAGRLGGQFGKRLATGKLIDRNQSERNGKKVKTTNAPDALARFFRPIAPACTGYVYSCECEGCRTTCRQLMIERDFESQREVEP